MISLTKSPLKAPDYRTTPLQCRPGKTPQCSKYERKYDHGFNGYHYGEWHKRRPYYGAELPPYQPGQIQYHLDPSEVKNCLEQCDFEHTKYHKPPCRPQGKYPVTKKCKPEYAHKPTFSEIFDKIKFEYDQVKHVF